LGASTHLSRRTESGSLTFTVEFCTANRIDVVKEIDYYFFYVPTQLLWVAESRCGVQDYEQTLKR